MPGPLKSLIEIPMLDDLALDMNGLIIGGKLFGIGHDIGEASQQKEGQVPQGSTCSVGPCRQPAPTEGGKITAWGSGCRQTLDGSEVYQLIQ